MCFHFMLKRPERRAPAKHWDIRLLASAAAGVAIAGAQKAKIRRKISFDDID
jgi:hypothetical protein